MRDVLANFPPFIKYVVLTAAPWIELRGSVPLAVGQDERGFLLLVLLTNCLVFFPTYFILEWIYEHIPTGSWIHRQLERIRDRAHPLVEKYGVLGLALFVAVPLPGTGAYSGSMAAWLLHMDWKRAFFAVTLGVVIAFGIVWALSEAVAAGIKLF